MEFFSSIIMFCLWLGFFVFPVSVEMDLFDEGVSGLQNTVLHGCNTAVRIRPNVNLDSLFKGGEKAKIKIQISLDNLNTAKSCGRSTYHSLSTFEKCGVENVMPLLPVHSSVKEQYTNKLNSQVTSKGETDYIFDGGTAVRYPSQQLPLHWFEKYTVTGWLFVEESQEHQYIFSWSNGDTPRVDNTGIYVVRHPGGNHITFVFHHMHEDEITGSNCLLKTKWKLKTDGFTGWNYFSLSFSKCKVNLNINGRSMNAISGSLHFQLPEKHIQPKFVIGARWAGSIQKYDKYLHGKISGFILKAHENLDMLKLSCLLECNEKLKLMSTLPSGFQVEETNQMLTMKGLSKKEKFHDLIHDIIYVNTDDFPETEVRNVNFEIANLDTGDRISAEQNIQISRRTTKINIDGECQGRHTSVKQGVRMCRNLKIKMSGCSQIIDSLVVEISPNLTNLEKIFIPAAFLKRHQLKMASVPSGFIVYGLSSVEKYTEILHHIKYAHVGFVVGQVTRNVSFTVGMRNGLIKSNVFSFEFTVSQNVATMLPVQIQDSGPHFINIDPLYVGQPGKQLATKTNQVNHHYTVWLVVVCVFSTVMIAYLVGYGWIRYNRTRTIIKYDSEKSETVPTEYFWDEEGLPMRLTINPSERVSITNDPYADILLKQTPCEETVTDSSVYSDDDETNFDNDSIRQLEWDSLENSLDALLDEENVERKLSKPDGNMNHEVYF